MAEGRASLGLCLLTAALGGSIAPKIAHCGIANAPQVQRTAAHGYTCG